MVASSSRLPAPVPTPLADGGRVQVHLLADPLHTGLVFELRWLEECGYVKPPGIGNHRYVSMSWGDETAYVQERWLSPVQVFRALVLPTPSVMECIPFDWKVEEVCLHQRVYVAELPRSSGVPLARFLNAHAQLDEQGRPLTVAATSWGDGRLIRCPDELSYRFPRMCNRWTAEALASAGLPVDGTATLTAGDVIRQATSPGSGFRLIWDPVKAPGTRSSPPLPAGRESGN